MPAHRARHRAPRLRRSSLGILSALLAVALVAWLSLTYLLNVLRTPGCDRPTTVTIAAAPDVAPALSAVARRLPAPDQANCSRIEVSARGSADAAASLGATDAASRPAAWVPESTLWLRRARQAGGWDLPETGISVASTPVVLAMTDDVAKPHGWPDRRPTWADLIGAGPSPVPTGIVDPALDPTGTSALLAVRALAAGTPDPNGRNYAVLHDIAPNVVGSSQDLLDRLPGGPKAGQTPLRAFPISEHDLLQHNAQAGAVQLVAAYPDPAVPVLDHPFVVLPGVTDAQRQAAQRFLNAALDPAAAVAFGAEQLRTPDGRQGAGWPTDDKPGPGTLPVLVGPVPLPTQDQLLPLQQTWAGLALSGRVLTVMDVSGSMNAQVPGTDQSRMQVTVAAALQGIGFFKQTTELGLWIFSTGLDGNKPYKSVVPVEPVAAELTDGSLQKLQGIKATADGGTGLYTSFLDAYRAQVQQWDPTRLNGLLIMTDGQNDDPKGISRTALIDGLKQAADPKRPITVAILGLGPDVDMKDLTEISGVVGGRAYAAPDLTKVKDVFNNALATAICQSNPDTHCG